MIIREHFGLKIPMLDVDGEEGGGDTQAGGDTDAGGTDDSGGVTPPERPEFIPDKFWDAEKGEVRLEGLAKSYGELEKNRVNPDKLKEEWEAARLEGRPDTAGDYALPDDERYDADALASSPIVATFRDIAHQAGMNQEQFEAGLSQYAEVYAAQMEEAATKEIAALGENAQTRLDAAKQWSEKNFEGAELEAIQQIATTAAGVKVLERFMKQSRESGMDTSANGDSMPSSEWTQKDVEKIMASPDYYKQGEANEETRQKVQAWFQKNL
jgi:hypothetical protein